MTIGQRPVVSQLQRAVLSQLGGSAPADADESALLEALGSAAAGRRVLLVIDDAWDVEHERALLCLDEGTESACLLTTRISSLVRGYSEVELATLDKVTTITITIAIAITITIP